MGEGNQKIRQFCKENGDWLRDIANSSEQPKILRAMASTLLYKYEKMREEESSGGEEVRKEEEKDLKGEEEEWKIEQLKYKPDPVERNGELVWDVPYGNGGFFFSDQDNAMLFCLLLEIRDELKKISRKEGVRMSGNKSINEMLMKLDEEWTHVGIRSLSDKWLCSNTTDEGLPIESDRKNAERKSYKGKTPKEAVKKAFEEEVDSG